MKKISTCDKGCSRFVYLIGRYAIKVPYVGYGIRTFVRGWHHNLTERLIYRVVKDYHRPDLDLLCPILHSWLGGLVQIMPRAETGLNDHEVFSEIYERINEARLNGDEKSENYGRLNGRIVKLDYADCTHVLD